MHRPVIHSLRNLAHAGLAALLMCTFEAHGDVFADGDRVMVQVGPYVYHRVHDAEHNNVPWLIGAEWESESRWEFGASFFRNSFYQPSTYIYGGKRWFLRSRDDGFYFKLTAGPLYGYKDPYEDKIPLNYRGVGLAIIPGIGYQHERASVQLVILGTAGVMLTFGYDFWK